MPEDPAAAFDDVARRIYEENPSWWPHGLRRSMLDGGAWLLQKDAKPAGFVGLQIRNRPEGRVGYYAIGVLPEYRGKGVAKEAVQRMLAENRDRVDTIRAMIAEGNTPSHKLASSLGVQVEPLVKKASFLRRVLTHPILTSAAVGGTVAGVNDLYTHPAGEGFNRKRLADMVSNVGIGALGGAITRNAFTRTKTGLLKVDPKLLTAGSSTIIGAPIVKPILARIPGMMDSSKAASEVAGGSDKLNTILKTLGVVGGLGIAGYGASKLAEYLKEGRTLAQAQQGGKVRVTLPTKNPGDGETQIEFPVASVPVSNSLQGGLNRDVLRRLRREVASRTYNHGKSPDNAEAVYA